jgi:hypothetical protein
MNWTKLSLLIAFIVIAILVIIIAICYSKKSSFSGTNPKHKIMWGGIPVDYHSVTEYNKRGEEWGPEPIINVPNSKTEIRKLIYEGDPITAEELEKEYDKDDDKYINYKVSQAKERYERFTDNYAKGLTHERKYISSDPTERFPMPPAEVNYVR